MTACTQCGKRTTPDSIHTCSPQVQTIKRERTDCGFQFGAATVECLASDDKRGVSIIGLQTPKHSFQIHVTKTGKVRIFSKGMEVLHG